MPGCSYLKKWRRNGEMSASLLLGPWLSGRPGVCPALGGSLPPQRFKGDVGRSESCFHSQTTPDLLCPPSQAPQALELPAVAGHTLTARRGLSLLLVGGYSPENGFNQQLLEYQLATGTWVSGAQSGTPPTGGAGNGKGTVPLTSLSRARNRLCPLLYSGHCPPSCIVALSYPWPPPRVPEYQPWRSSVSLFMPLRLCDKPPISCPVSVGHNSLSWAQVTPSGLLSLSLLLLSDHCPPAILVTLCPSSLSHSL